MPDLLPSYYTYAMFARGFRGAQVRHVRLPVRSCINLRQPRGICYAARSHFLCPDTAAVAAFASFFPHAGRIVGLSGEGL